MWLLVYSNDHAPLTVSVSLFKWSCSIDCQAHIFFFKTKNCSNDDIFISCDDRIGKMLHNICMSAVAMSLRWASCIYSVLSVDQAFCEGLYWYTQVSLCSHLSSQVPSDWRPGGRGFNPRRGRQHSFVEIDHEIFSTVILSLPLIQEGQLSVSGERMCILLVNRLED